MTTPTKVGAPARSWTKINDTPVDDLIEQAFDALAELLEAGTLRQSALDSLYRSEEAAGTHPIARRLLLTTLRRAIADPAAVGANPTELAAAFTCRCGPGRGMVEVETGWRPCDRCNPGGYRIWRECHLTGCHGCPTCRPDARRRGMQGDHRAERAEAEAERRDQRVKDDLR